MNHLQEKKQTLGCTHERAGKIYKRIKMGKKDPNGKLLAQLAFVCMHQKNP